MANPVTGRTARRLFASAASVAAAFAFSLATAPQAAATAGGCTTSTGPGYVCVNVYGSGLRVDKGNVVRTKPDGICNYRAALVAKYPGRADTYYWGNYHHGCVYGRAYVDVTVQWTFGSGVRLCGYFYDSGALQPGQPCVTVRR
ncbi:hypothetical protein [Streptomyces erythrochromogenes]|uniref:hypothetical protein n=1 Tax=Streptomyces erythrochromogenes TaxID=285574 RepID=UPI003678A92C